MDQTKSTSPQSNGNDILPPSRWGIFRRSECSGALIVGQPDCNQPIANIYRALKKVGFRETYWQYVYPGQIGGLVFNPRKGLIEHHVRFFNDGRMYVEIEFGRSAILHFLNRRMYLNRYLIAKLRGRISVEDASYFCDAVNRYKESTANNWSEWSMNSRFYTPGIKMQVRLLTLFGDWRFLAAVMLVSFGIVSGFSAQGPLLPILTATMIFIYLIAPKRV